MSGKLASKTVFLATVIVAVLVVCTVFTLVFAQLIPESTDTIDSAGKDGYTTRYVIEGTFDVAQDGDLIKYSEGVPFFSAEAYHWKKIDVPQLTLSDMPFVHVYVRTTFDGVENDLQPMQLWKDPNSAMDTIVQKTGIVLYDEGCVYLYYKKVITPIENDAYSLYETIGEYTIVVIK